jgi:predicted DNA-binding transcriptional regulator YafY
MPKEVRVAPASLVGRRFVQAHPVRVVLPEVWDTVVTALNERMAVEVEYVKPGQPAVWRTLQPYALILATSGWLVPARDANDPDGAVVKIFHLSRMRTARATTARYAIPRDFSPEDYLGDTIGTFKGKPFRFRVRFAASLAGFVQEVRWHPRQTLKLLESGEVELDLPSESTWEARRFVLSFGRLARAVSPPELVAEVAEELRASAGLYP